MSESYTPPTKKSYSLSALAFWGERLASPPAADWENLFTEDALYGGRRLYRDAKIAEIILGTKDAAVVFRVPAENPEAPAATPFLQILFDFDEAGRIRWRSSSSAPRRDSAPFAVAGLYVVEEFVASEYPNLPLSAGTAKTEDEEKASAPEKKPAAAAVPAPVSAESAAPARRLVVRFASAENEISFTAFWRGESGKDEDALAASSAGKKPPSPSEREQLIRLVAAARKAGFSFVSARGAYVLAGTPQAIRFADEFLPLWQKRFEIEGGRELGGFSRSAREIDARLLLRAESGDAFSLEWDFSLDGESFSAAETRAMLKHRGEAVFLPGRGVVRLRAGTSSVADDWPDPAAHGVPIYTLLSLFRDGESDALVPDAKLRAWRKNFLREPAVPDGLPAFLRPYQARGVAWIHEMFRRGAHPLLADEMGLGKTLQTLAVLSLDAGTRRDALIVCPASVIPVWKNEIRKFFPRFDVKTLGADGDFRLRKTRAAGAFTRIWLASYGMLRAHADQLPKKHFSCAVLDEAQYIKNPQAKITHACLQIVADKRLALTGTPVENRHLDLWTVFRFLMPGLLGRRATLENELAEDDAEALEKLKTQIAPFILRRTKQEVARELPEKIQTVLHCPLTPEQRERYERIVRDGLAELAPAAETPMSSVISKNPTHLLTLLMRLRQAACDPALLPGQAALPVDFSGKIRVLLERLEEIFDNGGKVVVFSQFVSLLDRVRGALEQRFAGTPIFTLTGKTIDRETPVKDFQTRDGAAVFLVSLRAGGTGLTLHSAEYVFLLDPWWNPAVEEQAIDRVHRIGQTRRVFVYRMVATGTIEERIEKLKQSKRTMFDTLVGELPDMSDWASQYPSLESLIALSE